jgi:diaminopimelate epimerase
MKSIPFTKASACGNTFLLIEGRLIEGQSMEASHESLDLSALSRQLCDQHRGIGADGVEWIFPDTDADVAARLINADGSEAEISGNGTRCVAAEICSRRTKSEIGKTEIMVRTGAGLKACRLTGQQGSTFEFETNMGQPQVGDELAIEMAQVRAVGSVVSMGNPHYVIFGKNFHDGWQRDAALIAAQPQFPHGTNVEYAVVRGTNEIEIRLFERGVGETQSSGTGSCAVAVAAIASQRVSSPVTVVAPGGAQVVRWERDVYLRGPAQLICRGEFFI